MDREDGLDALVRHGWLSAAPGDFQRAVLSRSSWHELEAGAPILVGGDKAADMFGIAQGCVGMSTIFGTADTPLMHLAHAVLCLGYGPIMSREPRRVSANAKSTVSLARISHVTMMRVLTERPEWWQHFLPLALAYADGAANVAADLLIRGSERRCAAVLLRLSGSRFVDPIGNKPVEIPFTQDELAAATNLSRNTANTVLRKLEARGLIELGYRGIVVCAPAALRAIVNAE